MTNRESEIAPKGVLHALVKKWDVMADVCDLNSPYAEGAAQAFRDAARELQSALAAAEQPTPPTDVQQGGAFSKPPRAKCRVCAGTGHYYTVGNGPKIECTHCIQPSPSVSDGEASVEQRAREGSGEQLLDVLCAMRSASTQCYRFADRIESAIIADGERRALSQQENTKQAGWIAVTDCLPAPGEHVDVFPGPQRIYSFYAHRDGGNNGVKAGRWYHNDEQGYDQEIDVTHWRPALTPTDGGSNG